MRVACFQFDIQTGEVEANLAEARRGLAEARAKGVELLLLPEMWPTSFVPNVDSEQVLAGADAKQRLVGEASQAGIALAGSAFGDWPSDPIRVRPTNRLELFVAGKCLFAYDKVHLFSPTAEPLAFGAGHESPCTADTPLGRISGGICYDLRFSELWRRAQHEGAELLLIPAQWPVARAAHWDVLVRARAVMNQCFVMATNRSGSAVIGRRRLRLDFPGNSMIVSPHGEVLARGEGREGLVVADIDLEQAHELRGQVPLSRDRRADLFGDG